MLIISNKAWVGCSWVPSPALITTASTNLLNCRHDPGTGWRITAQSIFMACIFCTVSLSPSPLLTLEALAEKLVTSADNLFSASSNEIRVRVEFSKKRFTIFLPVSEGTFLMGRSKTSRKVKPVSISFWISLAGVCSKPIKCLFLRAPTYSLSSYSISRIASSPSTSSTCTWICSLMDVG